jgi:polysaccharide biosynthesis/export protein
MRSTPSALCRAPLAALIAIGLAAALMPSALRVQAGNADILTARTPVLWSIQSADGQPMSRMNGEAIVGPDGSIELGPYGRVQVAGMTVPQAQAVLERHLARYLRQPRVSLQRAGYPPAYAEPASLVTTGRLVPMAPVADSRGPAIIATSAQQVEPVVEVEPVPTEPPSAEVMPENKPAEPVVVSGATTGQWRPLVRDNPAPSARNGNSDVIVGTPVVSTPVISSSGYQPLPRGPMQDSRMVQAEPPTDLKIYPRQVEPGPVGMMPGAMIEPPLPGMHWGPNGGPVPHAPEAPHELTRVSLPPYVIDPPDVLLIESTQKLPDQPIRGQHLVRPDGTISLGIYGSVEVRGMTLDQAKDAIARQLASRIAIFKNDPEAAQKVLSVDVLAYNSKFYYIVTDGGGYGEQVTRFPITGSETVLDALSQIGGLNAVASKQNIWVARTTGGHPGCQKLPVDWNGIVQCGDVTTNYQVMPNDRIYVKAKCLIAVDTALARILSPVERVFGITLLGSTTFNSIKNRGNGSNGVP